MQESWINHIRRCLSITGVTFKSVNHKCDPVFSGRIYKNTTCPKCGSKNAFVFKSRTDETLELFFCKKCNKFGQHIEGEAASTPIPEVKEAKVEAVDPNRCTAVNKNGSRCKNKAVAGDCFCKTHANVPF